MLLGMTATTTEVPPAVRSQRFRIGMRWKLVLSFGVGFTVVFLAVAVWILRFSTETANERLKENLEAITVGGVNTLDVDNIIDLIENVPAEVPIGETYPRRAGSLAGTVTTADSIYPVDPRYWNLNDDLYDIRRTNPEASPYTYYVDDDGVLRGLGSWAALGFPEPGIDEPAGFEYKRDVSYMIDEYTSGLFVQGLTETTEQPPYRDNLGNWISVYTPIVDDNGVVVAGFGVDYPLSYVDDVRGRVLRVLYPVFIIAYVLLLFLVYQLSSWLTRRLGRLTTATQRVADGDYEVDLTGAAQARFADEMTELAESFSTMTKKVGARERKLVTQMQSLKVEIDHAKKEKSVAEIIDTDFFSNLTQRAADIRAKAKGLDDAERALSDAAKELDNAEPRS
jgi:HAMP domain-containing protein